MQMDSVWFVAHGLAGYGPDTSDGTPECESWEGLADTLNDELKINADFAMELASILGDADDESQRDYKGAWLEFKRAESLHMLAASLDNKRKDAPLYHDDADAWHATIKRIVEENFPVDVSEHGRLYAWPVEPGTELECGCMAGDVANSGHKPECDR